MADKLKLEGVFSKGYGIVPKLVMKDEDLSIEAKAIYAYLCSYAGAGKTAFPSVDLICNNLGISENRFYKHRKPLVDKGYINVEREKTDSGWSNNIYTLNSEVHLQIEGIRNEDIQNIGIQNEGTNNNILNNNNINNNSNINSPAKAEPHIPFEEIVSYLNKKTNSNYRHTTKATQNLIKARVNDGFELSDFSQVIDTKSSQWLNDKEMAKYLRPQTLFGTKFESYLNEQPNRTEVNNEYADLF